MPSSVAAANPFAGRCYVHRRVVGRESVAEEHWHRGHRKLSFRCRDGPPVCPFGEGFPAHTHFACVDCNRLLTTYFDRG